MADDAAPQTDATEQPERDQRDGSQEFEPITNQDEFEKRLGKRLERERAKFSDYDDLRSKAEQFDQLEQEKKSELEKLTEDRDGLKSRAESAELSLARLDVALDKGLTRTQAKRLVGSTREELEADADELLADLGGSKPRVPRPNAAQSSDETPPQGDWLRAKLARS